MLLDCLSDYKKLGILVGPEIFGRPVSPSMHDFCSILFPELGRFYAQGGGSIFLILNKEDF